jgi:polyisoprenyl-teichoic acid--peptidoglycan teichoic acid transferase
MARRRFGSSMLVMALTAVAVGGAGKWHVRRALDRIETLDVKTAGLPDAAVGNTGPTAVENYLLIGSDSREGADPNDPDYGGIGSAGKTEGLRSDTMLVLRYDPATKSNALLSIQRDLWVTVADNGKKNRINEAFDRSDATKRSQNMIDTVSKNLGIPIHHYVEVNFAGFKRLVDAIGGVDVYFPTPARDRHTGLSIPTAGCAHLDGVAARQYVRSRYYERFENGKWSDDGSSDFGRTDRQRDFIRRAINGALAKASSDPRVVGELVKVLGGSIRKDADLDVLGLANQLRTIGSSPVAGYSLAVKPVTIGGASVLQLDEPASRPVLRYFKGEGPIPTAGADPVPDAPAPAPAPAAPAPAAPAPAKPTGATPAPAAAPAAKPSNPASNPCQ